MSLPRRWKFLSGLEVCADAHLGQGKIMAIYTQDGYTSLDLSRGEEDLWFVACVHCGWIAAGKSRALVTCK
jgi:hypothetical protein